MIPRSILITGCSSGIGLAAARTLKSRGWRVIATARKDEDLARLERDEGVEAIPLELADQASIEACTSDALKRTDGKLLALYNNAAYGVVGAMEDTPATLLRDHFQVNVIAANELARRLIPAMRANRTGRIVNCSSVLGFVSGPYRGAYSASKFALEAMTDAMRLEVRDAGIHVSLLEPGPIATSFMATTIATFRRAIDMEGSVHRDYYRRRIAELEAGGGRFRTGPETVVAKLVHALESPRPKARYRISLPTHAAAFMKRVLPSSVLDAVVARF
ncbi:MAG TPA: SDR family NAD(P)-dependent oxidoreductase [Hyphomicrobiaceae bacterium]|nr:SDR family NAD(P)-dependent oxidoreductase [Hyphomicrobiaceae bacterium]